MLMTNNRPPGSLRRDLGTSERAKVEFLRLLGMMSVKMSGLSQSGTRCHISPD